MTDTSLPCYRPNGRICLTRLWRLPAYALPILAVVSWAYAVALRYGPPALLAPLITLFYAVACAVPVVILMEKVHSRSPRFNTVMAMALVGFAFWVRWVVTFRSLGAQAATQFALSNPLDALGILWDYGVARAQADPHEFSALASALIWLLEVAMVGATTVFLARHQAFKPYSEAQGTWAREEAGGELYLGHVTPDAVRQRVAKDGIAPLLELARADRLQATPLASEWSTLKITSYSVPEDETAFWLSLDEVRSSRSSEGKVKSTSLDILRYWAVEPAQYRRLMAYLHAVDETGPAAPEPSRDDDAERPTPTELEPALAALQADNPSTALRLAEGYRTHPQTHVREDALRLCALAESRLARWADAYDDFHALFELEPTAHSALQLATTSVMSGQLLRGQAWFDEADTLNTQSGDMPPPQLRTAFLSALEQAGEYAACEPHLVWLRDAYASVASTDSHRLWSYGLPFFSEFLAKSKALLEHHLDAEQLHAWFQPLKPKVDADGQAAIDAVLETGAASPGRKPA